MISGASASSATERVRRSRWAACAFGGRVAYRIKKLRDGRAKQRVMTPVELLARLTALIPPPRCPLVRYHGVFAPRAAWRREIVPKPRRAPPCKVEQRAAPKDDVARPSETSRRQAPPPSEQRGAHVPTNAPNPRAMSPLIDRRPTPQIVSAPAPVVDASAKLHADVIAPNVMSVRHWSRLLDGALVAITTRLDWATLLRRTFEIDVMECAKCGGRLRILGSVSEPDAVREILERLAIPTEAPSAARARDPTDFDDDDTA
jgi:hypothetical protein